MAIYRYSATEMFGVPIDNPDQLDGMESVRRAMGAYGIEPVIMEPMEATDITPDYWPTAHIPFRYLLSSRRRGHALLEHVPTSSDSLIAAVNPADPSGIGREITERTVRLPEDSASMIIAGPNSPRFAGKICIYEAFLDLPEHTV